MEGNKAASLAIGRVLVAAAVLFPATAGQAAAPAITLSARSTWAENLSRTSDARTAKDSSLHELSVAAAWNRQFSADWQFGADATASHEDVTEFGGLDAQRISLRGSARRKFGLGPQATVLDLGATLTRAGVDEGGRSGLQGDAGVRLSRRFHDTIRAGASVDWTRYYAKHAPFDVRHHRLSLDATWDATSRWQLAAGISRLDGQLTANAAGGVWASALAGGFGASIAAYYNTVPWHVTHTYGPGWVAYRVDARADFLSLGATATLGDRTSLPLRYERVDVENRVGVEYVSEFWSLSLVHRF